MGEWETCGSLENQRLRLTQSQIGIKLELTGTELGNKRQQMRQAGSVLDSNSFFFVKHFFAKNFFVVKIEFLVKKILGSNYFVSRKKFLVSDLF